MMSRLRDMEHREMVDELNRKISQLESEVHTSSLPRTAVLNLSSLTVNGLFTLCTDLRVRALCERRHSFQRLQRTRTYLHVV